MTNPVTTGMVDRAGLEGKGFRFGELRMLKLLRKVGWHSGQWSDISNSKASKNCSQILNCWRCGEENFRMNHEVFIWKSVGFFESTESGVCAPCGSMVTRDKSR